MIPINYVSRHEALRIIVASKFSGIPDPTAVVEARLAGIDAKDGRASDDATAELWRAVDQGKLEAIAHGSGVHWWRMSPEETKQVPLLRAARGGDFTLLRPGNPFHGIAVSRLGARLDLVTLAFPKDQVEKLAKLVRRRRRHSVAERGRPSREALLRPILYKIVEEGRWHPTMSLKTLTNEVKKAWKGEKLPSEDTVTRCLDKIYRETKDRRFERHRRTTHT